MRRFKAFAAGALVAYFMDPQSGARRRSVLRDRIAAFFRGQKREAESQARYAAGKAEGVAHKAKQAVPGVGGKDKEYDDVTLARKVESEIFRDPDVPKGSIDVNAENGVVFLRGQVERPDQLRLLVAQTKQVQGVSEVKSLLHLPGEPAPAASEAKPSKAVTG
jgi:osmotically-inducible protein OsmY